MASPSTGKNKAETRPLADGKTQAPELHENSDPLPYENWKGASPIGWVRFTARLLLLMLSLIICVPLYYIWRIFRLPNPWPKFFLASAGFCCGARVVKKGPPLKRGVFFISNHISWIDIPIFGGASGTAFVSKKEIARWPIIGWLCMMNDTVFVSRANRMAVADQINQLRDALEESWAITIFPEGTTSDGKLLLPFKSPLIQVLSPPPPGIMVQPIYLDYGKDADEIAWLGDETAPQNAWRILTRRGRFQININFLEPFDPAKFDNRKAIASEARKRIEAAMQAGHSGNAAVKNGL